MTFEFLRHTIVPRPDLCGFYASSSVLSKCVPLFFSFLYIIKIVKPVHAKSALLLAQIICCHSLILAFLYVYIY